MGTAYVSTEPMFYSLFWENIEWCCLLTSLDYASRNLLQSSEVDELLRADLSWPEIIGKSCVLSGWYFNSLYFHPRRDASRQRSVCTLLPHYCSCARLNRIVGPREPKSPYTVSLTSLCPVSDTLLWGSWLPKDPCFESCLCSTKNKESFALRCFGRKDTGHKISSHRCKRYPGRKTMKEASSYTNSRNGSRNINSEKGVFLLNCRIMPISEHKIKTTVTESH